MVVYWDTSALVAILGRAPQASHYRGIARQYGVVTWWGTYVECVSAIARRAREGNAPTQVAEAYRMLDEMANEWREVGPSERLRRAAARVLKLHILSAADALQLGAALVAGGFEPPAVRFLTEDRQLQRAAEREAFVVD